MSQLNQPIKYARLSQFVFELDKTLGHQSHNSIWDQIPHLSQEHKAAIQAELPVLTSQTYLLNPGLQPLLPNLDRYTVALSEHQELTPFLLHDTIILDISTTITDAPICSLSDQIIPLVSTLGQCTFIYLHSTTSDKEYADKLILELGKEKSRLSFKSAGKLLGSPVWEYSDGTIPYYLWIADNNKTIDQEDEGDYYQHLLNLLCCRAKIEYVAREAELSYRKGFECYNEIEARLQQISQLDDDIEARLRGCLGSLPKPIKNQIDNQASLRPQLQNMPHSSCRNLIKQEQARRIEILEDHLKVLPQKSYELAKYERNLATHLLTLNTNIDNFRKSSEKISTNSEDGFLQVFVNQECEVYRQQIAHNIQVLSPGQRFVDRFITSIRGMVEIDSQKQQLELEQEEKEREQRLQRTLTVLGSGLTVSGLASQTLPRPIEKFFPILENTELEISFEIGLWFLTILIHVAIGIIGAMATLLIPWILRAVFFRGISKRSAGRKKD